MEGWNPDNNPYHVLDLKAGASSSEIKKVRHICIHLVSCVQFTFIVDGFFSGHVEINGCRTFDLQYRFAKLKYKAISVVPHLCLTTLAIFAGCERLLLGAEIQEAGAHQAS